MLPRKLEHNANVNEKVVYEDENFNVIFHYSSMTEDGLNFIPHYHEEFEILYVAGSEAIIFCNEKRYVAKAGDIFIFSCNEPHSCLKAMKGFETKCIQFNMNFISSKLADSVESNFIRPIFHNVITFRDVAENDPELIDLVLKIEREFNARENGYQVAIKGHLFSFLGILLKKYVSSDLSKNEQFTDVNVKRMNFVYDYIAKNYTQDINLQDIAKELYINESYFCRIFKTFTGKSFIEYLNNYRVFVSVNLLTTTDKSISEIATICGFNEINYFSRQFKKYLSLTPSDIRRQSRTASAVEKRPVHYVDGTVQEISTDETIG